MLADVDLTATKACPCLAARRHARALTRHFDGYLRQHGLRSTQFSVLAALAQRGPTSIGRLADGLGLERTTLTRSSATLERHGWLASRASEDARERLLVITETGRRVLDAAVPSWAEARDAIAPGLDRPRATHGRPTAREGGAAPSDPCPERRRKRGAP